MNDKQLDDLLNAAKQSPQMPADFGRAVWRDIERRGASSSFPWAESLLSMMSLPLPRLAIWSVALGLGLFAGMRHHQKVADPVELYAYSINPLAPAISISR